MSDFNENDMAVEPSDIIEEQEVPVPVEDKATIEDESTAEVESVVDDSEAIESEENDTVKVPEAVEVIPTEETIEPAPVQEEPIQETPVQPAPAIDNVILLEQIRAERAQLERERITLAAAQEEFNIRKKEEIESTHLTKVGTFFWLHYLFNISFIGFICSIVFSFAGTNITRKNYARARLIWHLIRILCIVLLVLGIILLVKWLPGGITDLIPDRIMSSIRELL